MLTHVDIEFIERMQREYDSLTQRWRDAAPYSQETANLSATFKARDAELGNAVVGGLFKRMLDHVAHGVPGTVTLATGEVLREGEDYTAGVGAGAMAEISTTMQAALDYMRQHGGAIERRQGGFWIEPKHEGDYRPGVEYVSPRTVYALEKRGLVEIGYTTKRPRATLTPAGIKATNWTPAPGEDADGVPGVPEPDEDARWSIDRAADFLEQYAAFIHRVKPDEIEEHPYLPELEYVAQQLRRWFDKPAAGVAPTGETDGR